MCFLSNSRRERRASVQRPSYRSMRLFSFTEIESMFKAHSTDTRVEMLVWESISSSPKLERAEPFLYTFRTPPDGNTPLEDRSLPPR